MSRLSLAAAAFLLANLLHGIDHQRQGIERLTTEVKVGGVVLTLLAVYALVLVRRRSGSAPLVATLVGFYAAIGVAAAHIAPHWSALSDSYPDLGVDAIAWAVMLLEVATALALGVVGLATLRERGRGEPAMR